MQAIASGEGFLVAAALAALAASGGTAERPSGDGLVLVDFAGLPPLATELLMAEATAILEPVAGTPGWRAEAPGGEYAPAEIPVLLLGRGPVRGRGLVLGSAQRRAPRPAAWLFVEPVLRTLGLHRSMEWRARHGRSALWARRRADTARASERGPR